MTSIENATNEATTSSELDSVEEVIQAIARGEMVVVVDDETRENEGDLVCAADSITPEQVNFMALEGRGLICVTLPGPDLARMGIAEMPQSGGEDVLFRTAFMESVDASEDITTGISAQDRARTIQLLAAEDSSPSDFVRPGHVFPIKANPRGVLGRDGHTEASVDLARLSGRRPAGVICEIMLEDGTMARLDDLKTFSRKHGLKMCSVAALIEYRRKREGEVILEGEIVLPTSAGDFNCRIYRSTLDEKEHLALWIGDLKGGDAPVVRVHSECLTGDVLHSLRCDCGEQLQYAMEKIQEIGQGAILYMRQEGRGIGLAAKIKAYMLQDEGYDTLEANLMLGYGADEREYRSSALILHDLGVERVKLMTNNPAKVKGLEDNGIQVTERFPVLITSNPHNSMYMETKRTRMGHLL